MQLLPVNDTTAWYSWRDSYPYAAISVFALHPIYVHLPAIAGNHTSILEKYEEKRIALNKLTEVDYEQVLQLKWQCIRELYPLQKKQLFSSVSYQDFLENNKHWLLPYAAFCCLRDKHKTPFFNQWKGAKSYTPHLVAKLQKEQADSFNIHLFVQYHLHAQLKEASLFAHKNGVVLKGDIAIGVGKYSVDVWTNPTLYNTHLQAGAPPDDFAVMGQNWGFPTYNWHEMQEANYDWWKQRFLHISQYFDAIRIDHILGFFRIWSIPINAVQGILGYFVPAVPLLPHELIGIHVSIERLIQPFISDEILLQYFGAEKDTITELFLEKRENLWCFKETFNTQRKIVDYFAEKKINNKALESRLLDLIANVVLLLDEYGALHFRFNMQQTFSYQALDEQTKHILNQKYQDYFFHRQEQLWAETALERLPAVKNATSMLVCGEDLGLVSNCVQPILKQLEILTLEVQRMPKQLGRQFATPHEAPFLSVLTPSTHDTSTIRGWWREIDEDTKITFLRNQLNSNALPSQINDSWLVTAIIEQHLHAWSMWSIFLLQDILAMSEQLKYAHIEAERINSPDNPDHYWRYRSHISIETLLNEDDFNSKLYNMIVFSRRI